MKLGHAMEVLYRHKGYRTEVIDDRKPWVVIGLFSKGHEARICIGIVAEDPKLFSTLEKQNNFTREDLERCMINMFELLDQDHGDPWLCDVHFDCLTVYEREDNKVLCRLHLDIDEDMEV